MHIGIDASRALVERRTGTEVYSLELIRALLALESGHRLTLYTNGGNGERVSPDKAGGAFAVRSIPFPRLWTHLRLSLEMLAQPPDALFVPAHVLPLVHPRCSAVTIHDLGFLHFPGAHRTLDRWYLQWSTRWNARQAAAVIADSDATRRDLLKAYGTDPARVHVVHLGRDEKLGRIQDPQAIREVLWRYCVDCAVPSEAQPRYLLYLGTLQPRKNLARVLEAFGRAATRPDLADVKLILAGRKGWLYDHLFALVKTLGLEGRVIFPGFVPEQDVPALMSGALAFIFPSLYEGFGLPVLEAGACGVPVITSNTSSLPEVAGDAALLVDPTDVDAIADAIVRLCTDPELRASLAERGRQNVKRFSWEKCARETLAVIESMLKPTKRDDR